MSASSSAGSRPPVSGSSRARATTTSCEKASHSARRTGCPSRSPSRPTTPAGAGPRSSTYANSASTSRERHESAKPHALILELECRSLSECTAGEAPAPGLNPVRCWSHDRQRGSCTVLHEIAHHFGISDQRLVELNRHAAAVRQPERAGDRVEAAAAEGTPQPAETSADCPLAFPETSTARTT